MYLKDLHLRQFRNYLDQRVAFDAQKTILVGNNAQGKSNLLEAVELLSTLKSHRATRDRDLVLEGTTAGQIQATTKRTYGSMELGLTLRKQGRRTVALNREPLRRQIDFLGILNAVEFSSLDLELVRGAPERRRNWLDSLLVQLEPVYAYILQQYNKVLRQRNALLKEIRDREKSESTTNGQAREQLAIWDAQLVENGSRVMRRRARVLQRVAPLAQLWHASISGETEVLEIKYAPNVTWSQDDPEGVQQAISEKIQQRRIAEQQLGSTVVGPHRDEVEFTINQTPARIYGSQGQQRTLVLAVKLAELKLIEEVVGEPPLLLLDDVLAELDPNRQNQLLQAIQDRFQTLITTTHLSSFDAQWRKDSQILSVEAGEINQFHS
ncbi:MAG: DNA replication/repair protein RecF [Cyanobacteria bacterium QH_8_48_120]|jgi:DNA replication and repair protein RecF|nr:MAG: DNA replication/repair protein RecF [Cyanobacteria bacterium QH_10_48_56]PSO61792.1 MAG: DNA replication/repair protein RecF [Cyanobacteria bacterium QH_6_48_35]PSO62181.1 MAG: DNA replication/repair protein RecF [Cyanobacteria bacterium QH_7_48_89]PSO72230.1 MAG: DNA replication/repair protein RecF [Cyanobacteria bacterium QH_3_48_40]PSO75186.1 MAG: DNA replication/repair protein RecF [Cyanobacteria bacterium QS_1_48_34]PSO78327.1 MAG: DNA replication/repair protein RecF [Cyanobacteri